MDTICSQSETKEQLPLCPQGLLGLLDVGQMVVHTGNFRHDIIFNARNTKRYEIIDELRNVLFYVEEESCLMSQNSLFFKIYNEKKEEAAHVLVPEQSSCLQCSPLCHFTAVVYSPVGVIVGFIKRKRSLVRSELLMLSPHEEVLLRLRGPFSDLQVLSADKNVVIGRVSVGRWVGVMNEVRRTSRDIGLTLPVDLDVRIKCLLLSTALLLVHMLHK